MTPPLDRRAFVRLSSAAALAGPSLLGACADEPPVEPSTCGLPAADAGVAWEEDPLAVALDETVFSLPPQAGAMRHDAALIWGFAAGLEAVQFWVWRQEAEQRFLVHSGSAQTSDGYTKVMLDGLSGGQWYQYAWSYEDDQGVAYRSAAGRFRTALSQGCAEPLTVVATACTHRRFAPYRSLELMAAEQPDLFIHLGDMSYNDGATDQAQYRLRWHEALSDPGYRAILPACGMYVTWDDHEIVDSSSYYATGEARRRAGTEAWFETLATPRLGEDRFWDSYRWGDTAEFFVLDCRGERQPDTRRTPEAAYLSRAQMDWLKASLKASTSCWKVLANSVPMTNWPDAMIMEQDRWEGYQAQRQELLDYIIAEGIEGVLVLGGDFHCGAVCRLEPEGPAAQIFEVLVGPGANGGNPMAFLFQEGSPSERAQIFQGDQVAFMHHGMSTTTLNFDAENGSVNVRFVDPDTLEARFAVTLFVDGRLVQEAG